MMFIQTFLMKFLELFFANIGYITLIIFIFTFKKAIGEFLSRMVNISFKNKNQEIQVIAEPVDAKKSSKSSISEEPSKNLQKDIIDEVNEIKKKDIDKIELKGFQKVMNSFKEDFTVDDIKQAFSEYSFEEQDKDLLATNKHIYLYFLFSEKQYYQAINELEKLAELEDKEKIKIHAYEWLGLAYHDLSKSKEIIELWEKATTVFQDSNFKTTSIVNLASSLNKNNKSTEAKELLINRLNEVSEKEEKFKIYEMLFYVEKSLGNKNLALLCKDKSLEYSEIGIDDLFNTAYEESENGMDGLSILNYKKLLDINSKNDSALNNIAIKAYENNLHIIAIEYYTKAEQQNNTLAMANKGNNLLEAGFITEAKQLAEKAIQIGNPHKNIYTLLANIDSYEESERTKWNDILEQANRFQKNIREYILCYYLKSSKTFLGNWHVNKINKVEVEVEVEVHNNLNIFWEERINGIDYSCTIKAKLNNLSFIGTYKIFSDEEKSSLGLLTLGNNRTIEVYGYLSIDGTYMNIFSQDYKSDFSLKILKD